MQSYFAKVKRSRRLRRQRIFACPENTTSMLQSYYRINLWNGYEYCKAHKWRRGQPSSKNRKPSTCLCLLGTPWHFFVEEKSVGSWQKNPEKKEGRDISYETEEHHPLLLETTIAGILVLSLHWRLPEAGKATPQLLLLSQNAVIDYKKGKPAFQLEGSNLSIM